MESTAYDDGKISRQALGRRTDGTVLLRASFRQTLSLVCCASPPLTSRLRLLNRSSSSIVTDMGHAVVNALDTSDKSSTNILLKSRPVLRLRHGHAMSTIR